MKVAKVTKNKNYFVFFVVFVVAFLKSGSNRVVGCHCFGPTYRAQSTRIRAQ